MTRHDFRCLQCDGTFEHRPATINCPKCGAMGLITMNVSGLTSSELGAINDHAPKIAAEFVPDAIVSPKGESVPSRSNINPQDAVSSDAYAIQISPGQVMVTATLRSFDDAQALEKVIDLVKGLLP